MSDKALLCGINDYKTIGDLRGCVNDTRSIRDLLIQEFQFDESKIRVLPDAKVTKGELTKGWKWLLKDAQPGDRLVFHFSGHGSYTVDADDDEGDRRDELLCLHGMDWHDSDTYLLDDELREWTTQIPQGVAVTFLLDCCHSGTGTRFVEPMLSRAAETDFRSAASLSLDGIADRRLVLTASHRGIEPKGATEPSGTHPARQQDINQNTVLARFAPPPADIQVAINQAKRTSSFRDILRETRTRSDAGDSMNHVLWAGCRDDQTSADAYIDGDYHGAFTYHFCKAVRGLAGDGQSQKIIARLHESLSSERFDQIPQLEPEGTDGSVFGPQSLSPSRPTSSFPTPVATSGLPSAEQWQELLSSLQRVVVHLEATSVGRDAHGSRIGGRSLVYVHGICQHDAGFSNSWWNATAAHLSPATRQSLENNRHEVLWSRFVSGTQRTAQEASTAAEQRQMELMLEEILQERVAKEAGEQLVEQATVSGAVRGDAVVELRGVTAEGPMPRALFGVPGLNCIDDFVKYLATDSIRRDVIGEFVGKVRPLLERGDSVDVISHSWGTVVAFEALRSLDGLALPGRVRNWFTVGAALAISYVARRLRPGDGRKPTFVERWVNLNARGDAVGGSLQSTGMQVDVEFLRLTPSECPVRLGLVAPACAHSSYFQSSNTAVNRDIFARHIERS